MYCNKRLNLLRYLFCEYFRLKPVSSTDNKIQLGRLTGKTFTFPKDEMIVYAWPPIQSVCYTEQSKQWTDLSPNASNLSSSWKLGSQKTSAQKPSCPDHRSSDSPLAPPARLFNLPSSLLLACRIKPSPLYYI